MQPDVLRTAMAILDDKATSSIEGIDHLEVVCTFGKSFVAFAMTLN